MSLLVLEDQFLVWEVVFFDSLASPKLGWDISEAAGIIHWIFVKGQLLSTVSAVVVNLLLWAKLFFNLQVNQVDKWEESRDPNDTYFKGTSNSCTDNNGPNKCRHNLFEPAVLSNISSSEALMEAIVTAPHEWMSFLGSELVSPHRLSEHGHTW